MSEQENATGATPMSDTGGIGGHPRGLTTLFFTEMWERLSYYGMRSFLILFMTAARSTGGMALSTVVAARIYGLYTASVYAMGLPGGWVADHILGLRKAVFIGGVAIMFGHFALAVPSDATFYAGLILIVLGTGLLKPNISALVGELYDRDDPRKDGGFTLYYMGINIGALLAPLVCGTLAQRVGWHWGFGAAGVGMMFGLLQFVLTGNRLGNAGAKPLRQEKAPGGGGSLNRVLWVVGFGAVMLAYFLPFMLPDVGSLSQFVILTVGSAVFMVSLYIRGDFTATEKKRGLSIYFFFWVAALFWSAFEQAGSSLNLFADRMTDNTLLGFTYPSSWFQFVNPAYIILLAPVFSWLWNRMGSKQPTSPIKFGLGLLGVGLGFVVMFFAAQVGNEGESLVSPGWLISTYLLHTLGELCLSPVGLSVMTKLAPSRIVGQIMGVWFLAASVGNYLAGELAGHFETLPLTQLFGIIAAVNVGVAVVVFLVAPMIKRQMGGVH